MQVTEGTGLEERLEYQREVIEMQADVLEVLGFDLAEVVERVTPRRRPGRWMKWWAMGTVAYMVVDFSLDDRWHIGSHTAHFMLWLVT